MLSDKKIKFAKNWFFLKLFNFFGFWKKGPKGKKKLSEFDENSENLRNEFLRLTQKFLKKNVEK